MVPEPVATDTRPKQPPPPETTVLAQSPKRVRFAEIDPYTALITRARERATEVFQTWPIMETIINVCDPPTRLQLALCCQAGFRQIGPRMYRSVRYDNLTRMLGAALTPERQELYRSGVRVLVYDNISLAHLTPFIPEYFRLVPRAHTMKMLDATCSRALTPAQRPIASPTVTLDTGTIVKTGLTCEQVKDYLGYGAKDVQIGKLHLEIVHSFTPRPFTRGKVVDPIILMQKAEGVFSLPFSSIDIQADFGPELFFANLLPQHLENRHAKGLPAYRDIKLRIGTINMGDRYNLDYAAIDAALVRFNPGLVDLSIELSEDYGEFWRIDSILFDIDWNALTSLNHLDICGNINCEETGWNVAGSVRPECSNRSFRTLTYIHGYDPYAPILPSGTLETMAIHLSCHTFSPRMPEISLLARRIVNIGGLGCIYTVRPASRVDEAYLPLAQLTAHILSSSIEMVLEKERGSPGWARIKRADGSRRY